MAFPHTENPWLELRWFVATAAQKSMLPIDAAPRLCGIVSQRRGDASLSSTTKSLNRGRVVTPQCRHQRPRRRLQLQLLKDFFRPEKELYSWPMGTIAGYSVTIQKRLPSLTNWPGFNDRDERSASANHSSRLHSTSFPSSIRLVCAAM